MAKKRYYVCRTDLSGNCKIGTVGRVNTYEDGKPTGEVEYFRSMVGAKEGLGMAKMEARLEGKEKVWLHHIDFEWA